MEIAWVFGMLIGYAVGKHVARGEYWEFVEEVSDEEEEQINGIMRKSDEEYRMRRDVETAFVVMMDNKSLEDVGEWVRHEGLTKFVHETYGKLYDLRLGLKDKLRMDLGEIKCSK